LHEFKDNANRTWEVRIDVAAVKRLRAARFTWTDKPFDVTRLLEKEMQPYRELLSDVVAFVDVLWVLCRKQAEAAGVNEECFAEGLGGDALARAFEAFNGALTDFFPDPRTRESLREVERKRQRVADRLLTRLQEEVGKIDPEKVASELEQTFISTAGNAPASSGATPAASPSANST